MFAGHLADITCTRFHPNSNYVATGSSDRTIRLWDVLTGNCVRILTGHKVRRSATQWYMCRNTGYDTQYIAARISPYSYSVIINISLYNPITIHITMYCMSNDENKMTVKR